MTQLQFNQFKKKECTATAVRVERLRNEHKRKQYKI